MGTDGTHRYPGYPGFWDNHLHWVPPLEGTPVVPVLALLRSALIRTSGVARSLSCLVQRREPALRVGLQASSMAYSDP